MIVKTYSNGPSTWLAIGVWKRQKPLQKLELFDYHQSLENSFYIANGDHES